MEFAACLFAKCRDVINLLDDRNEVLTINKSKFVAECGENPVLPFQVEVQITRGNVVSEQ
jgi:hypothetical protein